MTSSLQISAAPVQVCYRLGPAIQLSVAYVQHLWGQRARSELSAIFEQHVLQGVCGVRRDITRDDLDGALFVWHVSRMQGDIEIQVGWRVLFFRNRFMLAADQVVHFRFDDEGTRA